jgi:hypothetical protein
MRIKVNHPDEEIASYIMEWLYVNEDVNGDEKDLLDTLLIDLCPQSRLWDIEAYLSDIFDGNIELSKNLKFIEC